MKERKGWLADTYYLLWAVSRLWRDTKQVNHLAVQLQ